MQAVVEEFVKKNKCDPNLSKNFPTRILAHRSSKLRLYFLALIFSDNTSRIVIPHQVVMQPRLLVKILILKSERLMGVRVIRGAASEVGAADEVAGFVVAVAAFDEGAGMGVSWRSALWRLSIRQFFACRLCKVNPQWFMAYEKAV